MRENGGLEAMVVGEKARLRAAVALFVTTLVICGCSRPTETTFVLSDAAAELPELHQSQIRDGLRTMFGTPTHPRLRSELPESAPDDDSDDDDSDDDDSDDDDSDDDDSDDDDSEDWDANPDESTNEEQAQLAFLSANRLGHGARVYSKRCSGCHGVSGDGHGPAAEYLRPKPRDYRKGVYKFTSTPYGQRPTRQDLVRTIRRGAKGTSMPAFPWMSQEDLDAVIDYVIYLSLRGQVENGVVYMADDYDEDEPLEAIEFTDALESEAEKWETAQDLAVSPISAEPAYNTESVELGRRLFIKSSCYSCHGENAKGQTEWLSPEFLAAQESAEPEDKILINYDAWGDPAPAADITARMLHGGRRPIDIYRRIYTGINGTPMPQFGQVFTEDPDAIWHMVHYVMHIVDGGDPTLGISVADAQAAEENQTEPAETTDAEDQKEAA